MGAMEMIHGTTPVDPGKAGAVAHRNLRGLKRPSAGAASGPGQPQGSIQAGDEGLEQPWEKDLGVLVGES